MSEMAKDIIEDGAYTLPEVLAEVVYVLKGVYHVERSRIVGEVIATFDKKINKILEN